MRRCAEAADPSSATPVASLLVIETYRQHDAGMLDVRVDPLLQNLRKDSRYKAVLVRMKLDGDLP